jgi:hypothetical protein
LDLPSYRPNVRERRARTGPRSTDRTFKDISSNTSPGSSRATFVPDLGLSAAFEPFIGVSIRDANTKDTATSWDKIDRRRARVGRGNPNLEGFQVKLG